MCVSKAELFLKLIELEDDHPNYIILNKYITKLVLREIKTEKYKDSIEIKSTLVASLFSNASK